MLDNYRPAAVGAVVAARLAEGKPQPGPDALTQIDPTLERLGKRYEWGHLDENSYRAEWERLQARRREVVEAASTPSEDLPFPLGSLMSAWDIGTMLAKRELLAAFLQEIDVLDNRVEAVRPPEDRAVEVAALLIEPSKVS